MHRHSLTTRAAGKSLEIPAAWVALFLAAATVLACLPALHGGFIFDDNVFLTNNPLIHASDGLRRFWFTREAADYWPVTSSSLWLEWRLWGMNAAGYHATNVVLHVANVLLFWAVLRRLGVPGAFFGALLFALHPMVAESAAWITERKNLLAMLFFLLSVFWFIGGRRTGYGLSLATFVLAMLSKGSVVVLPLVLLGVIAWRRRPAMWDFIRLAPFFLIATGLAYYESKFSTVLTSDLMQPLSLLGRLLRAGAIIWFYVGKALWPANLCFDYGQWNVQTAEPRWWLPLAATLAVTAVLWRYRRSWSRPALFGWAYFCVALLPAMGFAEVGFMRYSPVSNVYAHLALLGMAALGGAGWARLAETVRTKYGRRSLAFLVGATAATAAALGALTWTQCRIYSDAITLYRDTIARNPSSWASHTNLGVLLFEAGDLVPAIAHLEKAVQIKPGYPEAHNDLGNAYFKARRLGDAMLQYQEAVRLWPGYCDAHNNLGAALAVAGQLPEAIAQFQKALEIDPHFHNAQINLAKAQKMEHAGEPLH